jgi:outer membrane protein assembly factor BamB
VPSRQARWATSGCSVGSIGPTVPPAHRPKCLLAVIVVLDHTLASFACGGGTTECPLWSAALDGSIAGRSVIGAGGTTVYVGTSAGTVYALDATTGAVAWKAAVGSAVTDAPALAHGTLYVPTASGDLIALAAGGCSTGVCSPVWRASTGSRIGGQPVVAGGVVLTGSDNGALRAFDAAGCAAATCPALWSASTGSAVSGMAVNGGTLYVGTADVRLIAYHLPWPGRSATAQR